MHIKYAKKRGGGNAAGGRWEWGSLVLVPWERDEEPDDGSGADEEETGLSDDGIVLDEGDADVS